jgi:hypothetical protein
MSAIRCYAQTNTRLRGSVCSPRFICWLKSSCGKAYDFVATLGLHGPKVRTDCIEVIVEISGVVHSHLPHFVNDWVVHGVAAINSSGEQISGHRPPRSPQPDESTFS